MTSIGPWDRHPLLASAVRAAIAVPLAWLLVQWLPSPVGDYPYYAPMGAVIATSTNPGGSFKTGAQAVAAITLGGLAAIVADMVGNPDNPLPMAVAVLIAVLVTGWGWLGSMASWVPTAAVFTLLIGGGDLQYVALYTGILAIGAVVATLVTLTTPGQPLVQAQERLEHLRDALSGHMEDLTRDIEADRPLSGNGSFTAPLSQAQTAVANLKDAVNANPRVRRHQDEIAHARAQLQVFEHLADALNLLGRVPQHEADDPPPPVRAATVQALKALNSLVSTPGLGLGETERQAKETVLADLHRATKTLEQALQAHSSQQCLIPAGVLLTLSGTRQILNSRPHHAST